MPIRTVPGRDLTYHLIAFDEAGKERSEDGSLLSEQVRRRISDPAEPVTDVFLASHGWKGDVPAAIDQYDRWLGAMVAQEVDLAAARARYPGFRQLVVGLHWPSLPWGDERLPGPGGVLSGEDAAADPAADPASVVDAYAARIADTPAATAALTTIVAAARHAATADVTPVLKAACATLYAESGLDGGTAVTAPGKDHDGFDPELIIAEADRDAGAEAPTGTPGLLGGDSRRRARDLLLSPVRQLSFWKMKDRGRRFGEGGAHDLLAALQSAAPRARFHLMGHSFGCIVVSGAVVGPPAGGVPLPRPVESLFLVQGAFSLWAVCPDVPFAAGSPGYFHRLLADGLVKGPVVTTRSDHDTAVGRLYPLGAKIKRQYLLDPPVFPQYGGVGAFGFQGLGAVAQDLPVRAATRPYGFEAGTVYNVNATRVIAHGTGPSGAHSDIAHPEIVHLQWQAATAAR